MDKIWTEMYNSAKTVLNERRISDYVTCGEVSAAVCSKSGKIYTGVCIIEIMLDYATERIVKLGEITPEWWIK